MKPSAISATKPNKKKGVATRSKRPGKKAPPAETIALLKRYYPNAHCALNHRNAFELLIATILSAQCTDERVNMVTPALFKKFPTPAKMAEASLTELEDLIRSTGFFKNKAKSLKACSTTLVRLHGGEVPRTLEELVQLAGVGRKTANVVLGNAFHIASGIVVDTHVTRLSRQFGWVETDNAVQIERILIQFVPEADWILLPHLLISHGRAICKARKPQCEKCFLETICPKRLV